MADDLPGWMAETNQKLTAKPAADLPNWMQNVNSMSAGKLPVRHQPAAFEQQAAKMPVPVAKPPQPQPAWMKFQLADWLGEKFNQAQGLASRGIERTLEQPLPGLAPGFGMNKSSAGQLARDITGIATESEPLRAKMEPKIETPAVKPPEAAAVPSPNHPVAHAAGVEGKDGFITSQGQFVNRGEGAQIAKQTGQAKPGTGDALHSEDLKPGTSKAIPIGEMKAAGPVGADVAPAQIVPFKPDKNFIRQEDDAFFRLRQGATADKSQFMNIIEALPPEVKNSGLQERWFKYMEGDGKLSPQDKVLYDKYVGPLKQEETALFEELKKTDVDNIESFDPQYAHRMVKGRNKQFDEWFGDSSTANPVGGYRSMTTSSLKERVYYTAENASGGKQLLAKMPDGRFSMVRNGKLEPIRTYEGANQPEGVGDTFTSDGQKWTVRHAKTSEIESATPTRYYKNALASTIDNVIRLRAVARAVYNVNRLKSTPEFQVYAKKIGAKGIPDNWRSPTMPMFHGYRMEPKLADVIDDFWGRHRGPLIERLEAINRFAVTSLFWSPVPHALNAGAHWATARGWDWITPHGIRSLAVDSARAMREVITQGPEYQKMLREGAGLVYGSVANEQFYRTMLQRLGEDVVRNPSRWDPIARVFGVGPSDLAKMLYRTSSKALWSVSDMFMLQRVFELQRKGMGIREAIADAEKHIPNYRIPPQVLGSSVVAQILKEPALTEFSRYHYGMMKSVALMARDLAVGTPREKFEALGNIFATGALMYLVWPAINYGINKLTGDDKLTMGPKGSTTIPQDLIDLYNGDKDFIQVMSNLVTMAPLLKTGLEAWPSNEDWFTGKRIVEPRDLKEGRIGRAIAQEAEHVTSNLVQPYGMVDQAVRSGKPIVRGAIKQGLGLREESTKKFIGKKIEKKAQRARQRKPRGLIESLEKKIESYKGTQ